jgi:hypothetical protein
VLAILAIWEMERGNPALQMTVQEKDFTDTGMRVQTKNFTL